MMRFSLSGRLVEISKKRYAVDFGAFLDLAAATGYDAVAPRDGQVNEFFHEDREDELLDLLTSRNLACPCLWGRLENALRDDELIRKKLLFLQGRGEATLLIGYPEDPVMIRRYCDMAESQNISLCVICHINSPFEDLEYAVEFANKVNRVNFGLIVDPANIHLAGRDYGIGHLEKASPHLRYVQLQGLALNEQGDSECTRYYGKVRVRFDRTPLINKDAMNIPLFLANLQSIGYDGYINVLEPYYESVDPGRLASETLQLIKGNLKPE